MANKQMAFMIAGMSLTSVGTVLKSQDIDTVGTDDKLGVVLGVAGNALIAYSAGNITNAKTAFLQAAASLQELAESL
jgi:hypothetical protein